MDKGKLILGQRRSYKLTQFLSKSFRYGLVYMQKVLRVGYK